MNEADPASGLGLKLALTAIFVALNGFFVAAEFALVKVRPTRIEALARTGDSKALVVQSILKNLNAYLSGCQLGITIASLVLGWLAEPAIAKLLVVGLQAAGVVVPDTGVLHIVALAIALTIVTILHMTIGEQAPKIWAIQEPEKLALWCAYPLKLFFSLFRPFIWLVDRISSFLLRLVGLQVADEHGGVEDVEELRAILRAASEAGHISGRQRTLGENILGLMRLEVRHIMLPRVDVVYLSTSKSDDENLEIIKSAGHSRYPFCNPDLDTVTGLVHTRDVVRRLIQEDTVDLEKLVRPFPSVPDTQPIARLILDMQRGQAHSALVVDEHGTSVGMVFLEDALEEIVGPIHDEFDNRAPWIENKGDDFEMAGSVPLPDAAETLGLDLGTEEDTIGGFIVSRLKRLPVEGDEVEVLPFRAKVISMSRRRVTRVRFERLPEESPGAEPVASA